MADDGRKGVCRRHAGLDGCQDARRSGELDRDTGAIRTVGSARTAVAAVLIPERPGVWKVSEARYLDDPS